MLQAVCFQLDFSCPVTELSAESGAGGLNPMSGLLLDSAAADKSSRGYGRILEHATAVLQYP